MPSRARIRRTTPGQCSAGVGNDEVKADPRWLWCSDLPPAQASVPTDGTVATVRPSDEELDAPGGIERVGVCEVFGRQLGLTNPDKVLFPAADGPSPVTKRDLIRYGACAAPAVLPYLAGRALNMHRFPTGLIAAASGTSSCPTMPPIGSPAGTTLAPIPGRPAPTWSPASPPRRCGWLTSARRSGTPGPLAPTSRTCRPSP